MNITTEKAVYLVSGSGAAALLAANIDQQKHEVERPLHVRYLLDDPTGIHVFIREKAQPVDLPVIYPYYLKEVTTRNAVGVPTRHHIEIMLHTDFE